MATMGTFRSSSTIRLWLALSALLSNSLIPVQSHDSRSTQEDLLSSLVERTRRLIQSVSEVTAPSLGQAVHPPSPLRHLVSENDPAFTTVLDDGTTVASIQPICRALEESFVHNVTCTCTGSSLSFFSITCHYAEPVCSLTGTTCGTPVLALSIVNYAAFSATTCVYNYTRNEASLPDLCVSLQTCPAEATSDAGGTGSLPTHSTFCGCMAQVDGGMCAECSLCKMEGDGVVTDNSPVSRTRTGIHMDCSNRNAELVTDTCSALDVDLDVSGMSSAVSGFIPNFQGFCSQIESGLDNRIDCDCSDSGGGNFNVTCKTKEQECYKDGNETICAKVHSLVSVQDGLVSHVSTCSDYSQPFDLKETCVSFAFQPTSDTEIHITECQATYDGSTCSCELCNDGEGVSVDCSQAASYAKTNQCQPVKNVYEFFPEFVGVPVSGCWTASISSSIVLLLVALAWPQW